MGNIASPNIIRASDIMDLTNNSITTGNIYASGTSATIGTSDNPFNTVYANTYYGRKSSSQTLLGSVNLSTSGSTTPISDISIYPYIGLFIIGWGACPVFMPHTFALAKSTNNTAMFMFGQGSNAVIIYFPNKTSIFCQDNLTSGQGSLQVYGYC